MKKPLNYIQTIRFKILNDQMTRTEAILLALLLAGTTLLLMTIGNSYFGK
jgi:hypothetical protein